MSVPSDASVLIVFATFSPPPKSFFKSAASTSLSRETFKNISTQLTTSKKSKGN